MTERAKIRAELTDLLRHDDDIDRFLVDYFPNIAGKRADGMSRDKKITLLIEGADIPQIRRAIDSFKSGEAEMLGPDLAQHGQCRREISRLQYINQELEQRLSTQETSVTSDAREGLDHVSVCLNELEQMLSSAVSVNQEWFTSWGYETMHALESSLGRSSEIASKFRFLFNIQQHPPNDNYGSLLRAAVSILRRKVDANLRDEESLRTWKRQQDQQYAAKKKLSLL